MPYLDQQTKSSDQRPIQLRARPDLVIEESVYQGVVSWVVKDPVALKYFRVQQPEKIALELLDGRHSYAQIQEELERGFPDEQFRIEDVNLLVTSFHNNGLLISNAVGQAAPLRIRRNKELKQKAIQLLMSVMSLRFPGVDPERFLNWLYPKTRWFFTKTTFAICLCICLAASLLVLMNLNEFYRRLPEFQQFFNLKNILLMASIMIVTKSIHELGHGLMCKHYGGECHEIGFMLLVLTPAMYCNTSDSWLLPNKWHRIAIGAAGMYVEIVLAAICTFVWWYTQPGVIHYMSLNIIFLCSVSTLLFNANPLLRYDGYYMLSDYLEIPNLGQKSKMSMVSKLRSWCLGMDPVNSRLLPNRNLTAFSIYGVSAFVYRWFIMIMIFWFIAKVFEPYGLSIIGHAMIAMSIIGMLGIPAYQLIKFFMYPGRMREVKKVRFAVSVVMFVLVGFGLFMLPVPHYVRASFVVQPIDAQRLYITQSGLLTKVNFEPGDQVVKGDVVAELENIDQELTLERLQGALAGYEAELSGYLLNAGKLADASRKIETAKATITATANQISMLRKVVDELKLVANRDGHIIPPPNILDSTNKPCTLGTWSGTPLDRENRQAFLQAQTLFCLVANPNQMKAVLIIDQSDAKFVQSGQLVSLMLDGKTGTQLTGEIEFVSRNALKQIPRELSVSNGGTIAAKQGERAEEPLIPHYEATVSLQNAKTANVLIVGLRGRAKIHVGSSPLGQRFVRYLKTIVNFR